MVKQKTQRRVSWTTIVRGVIFSVVLMAMAVGVGIGVMVYKQINADLPPIDRIIEYQPPVTTQVFSDDGSLIAEFFSEKRYLVPLDRIPEIARKAFLAAEDDGFYRHRGIEPVSITRAIISNLVAGGKVQGGSTITQQVVKQLLLTPEKSYERKFKEMILAVRLEEQLSKDEILTLYLNHLYLGSGAYGIAAAGRVYFGKNVELLNLAEAALLAGLPQAPSRYSPFRSWPEAKARQRYVLNRMAEAGFITRDERDKALHQPLALATRKGNFLAAPYFVEHVRRVQEEKFGQKTLYEMGLRIHTTLDLEMQNAAEAAVRAGLAELTERHGGYRGLFRGWEPEEREAYLAQQHELMKDASLEMLATYEGLVKSVSGNTAQVQLGPLTGTLTLDGSEDGSPKLRRDDLVRVRVVDIQEDGYQFALDPNPPLEGALIAIEPQTGHIKALVGGYDFDRSQFNRVTQARRQPGSAFKPLVYAAALDRNFTPASVIIDEEVCFNDHGTNWCPRNFSEQFYGPTTLRAALTYSRNVVTVRLINQIGPQYLVKYLRSFGFQGVLLPTLSLGLGTAEVTPLELARAYCTFANKGLLPKPLFIRGVTNAQGEVIERYEPQLEQAIPPDTAYQVTSMLQDVIQRGTGRRANGLGRPSAGKTGTTNEFYDNWFVGYTPSMLAVVWVGFDTKRSLGFKETGGRNTAPIWKAFMEVATQDLPREDFPVPAGLKCVNVDPETGLRAVPGGPARLECFRDGAEPLLTPPTPPSPIIEAIGGYPQPVLRPFTPQRPADTAVKDFLRDDF